MTKKTRSTSNSHQRKINATKARKDRRIKREQAEHEAMIDRAVQEKEDERKRAFKDFVAEAIVDYGENDPYSDEYLATREEMELEAIKRLEFMTHAGLHSDVLKHFSYRGDDLYFTTQRLYFSDNVTPFCAVLYWVDDFDDIINNGKTMREIIDEFEMEFGCLVYHATLVHTQDLGTFPYLYYVNKQKVEWADDRLLLTEGRALIGCPNCFDSWDLSTTWWRIRGGGLGYSTKQVIPRTDYSLNHVHEGCADDDGMSIDPWWHEAAQGTVHRERKRHGYAQLCD